MKKIIEVLVVAVIAATVFFSSNVVNNSSSDMSLASLTNMNFTNANAEGDDDDYSYAKEITSEEVYATVYTIEGSTEFFVEVPIGATITGTFHNHFLGTNKNCEWALARCNQSEVGFILHKFLITFHKSRMYQKSLAASFRT